MDDTDAVELASDLVVVVIGPPTAVLAKTLWKVGLRPVRGQRFGTVWAQPRPPGQPCSPHRRVDGPTGSSQGADNGSSGRGDSAGGDRGEGGADR